MINRYTMQDFGVSDKDIKLILLKARDYENVKYVNKTIRNPSDRVVSAPHFYIDQMIEAQSNFVSRPMYQKRNNELLNILKDVKLKLDIEEISGLKFNEIVTIHKTININYHISVKPLDEVLIDLNNGYIAIPF